MHFKQEPGQTSNLGLQRTKICPNKCLSLRHRTAEVVGVGKSGSTRDERLGDVGLVVLDEVHYLGDPWRGSVWEEAIINCPRHIQVNILKGQLLNASMITWFHSSFDKRLTHAQYHSRPSMHGPCS